MKRILFVTGSDSMQFDLAKSCVDSIHEHAGAYDYDIAFLDLGCTGKELASLGDRVTKIFPARWEFGIENRNAELECRKGQISRPFLPEYFPDYEFYFWIDADAWVQDSIAIDLFIKGAENRSAALVAEIEASSKFFHGGLEPYLQNMKGIYSAIYGDEVASRIYHQANLNAGVFCFHKESNLWDAWKNALYTAIRNVVGQASSNPGLLGMFGLIDQIALNYAIRFGQHVSEVEIMPQICNWTCHLSLPAYDEAKGLFVEPFLPHRPLGIVHLTNPWGGKIGQIPNAHERSAMSPVQSVNGKSYYRNCLIQTTTQRTITSSLFRKDKQDTASNRSSPNLDPHLIDYDYVSPGLRTIWPDSCFPFMVLGDKNASNWEYLRKQVPHRWYVDRRYPHIGFVSRDEAAILYESASLFEGECGLEIGCWQGWSACHVAASGIRLDVIDPILATPVFRKSIERSLIRFGVRDRIDLHAGSSPEMVHELARRRNAHWSFFFIDGNHDGDAPLDDTFACLPYAADDCMMLFHDLASPHVSKALDYLRDQGWNTMIYHTMQIMGVAWRGKIEPIRHRPDPGLGLDLPGHLSGHSISR